VPHVPDRTAVIFDLDDTLYPERRFVVSGYAAVAEGVASRTGVAAPVVFRSLCGSLRRGRRAVALQELVARFDLAAEEITRGIDVIRAHTPRLRLPGASRLVLAQLRQQGHRLGLLTNGLPSTQRRKVAALGLTSLVDEVAYACDYAPEGKPDAACFRAVLAQLDVAASRAVFVGDHPDKDVTGARACGLRTIWLAGRHGRRHPDADAVAVTVSDVPTLATVLLEMPDAVTR